jgi:threonine/homoserine/homoserine lactone efflux protein
MSLEAWIAFCVLEIVLCLTPGPAVLYVAATAIARGPRGGVAGALGIVAGNTFYFALSALGVAAVVLASGYLFMALKWAGAAYLIWLGLRMLWSRTPAVPRAVSPGGAAPPSSAALAAPLARGFAVQAANPKALAFFAALVPQFIDPAGSIAYQMLILCTTSAVIEFCVLALYIWLVGHARRYAGDRWMLLVRRLAGGLLVAAGARLAFVTR